MHQHFAPFKSWIIFHGMCTMFCLSIYLLMGIWFFFYLLAILNNIAVNIHVQVSEWTHIFISLGYTLGVELVDYIVILCLTFWGNARQFSTVTEWLHHFTYHQQCMKIPISLSENCYFLFCLCFVFYHHHLQLSSVQSLSRVRLFTTPWIAACQASLFITNSWSLLKLMSIESVMPSSYLILCRPLSGCQIVSHCCLDWHLFNDQCRLFLWLSW